MMSRSHLAYNNLQIHWSIQVIFWVTSGLLLYSLFTREYDNGMADVLYTLLFHLPLVLIVYGNLWLTNRFFNKSRYFLYAIFMSAMTVGAIGFHYVLFNRLSDYIFPGYYFISYFNGFEITSFMVVYWIISLILFLAIGWFQLRKMQAELTLENNQVKLNTLKSQLNPHFLFNSLNNISGLIPAHLKTPREYVTKLSDSLHYMLYNTEDDYVLLEEEVAYLQHYIDLEKLRLNEPERIQFVYPSNVSGHLIAPLLLLPIVENCFKHGDLNQAIRIELSLSENGLLTLVSRNHVTSKMVKDGLGLKNLKNRLALIYPGKHQLFYQISDNAFHLKLTLDCNVQ